MGALTAVKVSLAMTVTASSSHFKLEGNAANPNLHPPAPTHLDIPERMMVPSG
jgi:hypothetical protein